MKRTIKKAESKHFDLIIVGGGITGACVAWDAALRGLSCLLLEKEDFGHATSAATSKLIHGGLRYLKNFELGLVRESLAERRIFEIIAPHLVQPIPFLLPCYGHGMESKLPLMAALTVYDVLGYDKKDLDDSDKRIPNHRFLSRDKTLEVQPGLREEQLSGAALYYDCQMHTPDRLTLEFILSAHEYGGEALNYFEMIDFRLSGNRVTGVVCRDRFTGDEHRFTSKIVINTSGPWADLVLDKLQNRKDRRNLIRSKGIHLITKPITREMAVVFKTASDRHFFIIPWKGLSLIGTTDSKFEGHPDDFTVTESDIVNFISEINEAFPGAQLNRSDVRFFYGGMRPIVDTETEVEVYDASRKYEVTDHAKTDGIEGLITALGGKYTTSRRLAQQIVDLVYSKLKIRSPECITDNTVLMGGNIPGIRRFIENAKEKNRGKCDPELVAHFITYFGSEYSKLVRLVRQDKSLGKRISPEAPHVYAELVHAIEHEMAMTLDDLLFRRTNVGLYGPPDGKTLEQCAVFAAKLLGWNKRRIDREIEKVLAKYQPG